MTELNAETLFKNVLFQRVKWLNYTFTRNQICISSDEAHFIEL